MTTLGWAAYLGMSWTWCIGMFLPVLLVRDYGIWGFVVFAVPNVVGAAAMGWVLRDGASERIVTRHRTMLRMFSIVTMAFQIKFATWLIALAPVDWRIAFVPIVMVSAIWFYRLPGSIVRPLAWIALAVSLVTLVTVIVQGPPPSLFTLIAQKIGASGTVAASPPPPPAPASPVPHGVLDLLWLAPVCVFGFLLCPYLDLTFHRARHTLSHRDSRRAFGIGFGVFFASMILLTLLYAPAFDNYGVLTAWGTTLAAQLIVVHIVMQLAYTCGVHNHELVEPEEKTTWLGYPDLPWTELGAFCALALLSGRWFWSKVLPPSVLTALPLPFHELSYRCFMSFYGLVFPAYVWICMIPTRDGHSGIDGPRGRRRLMVLSVAVLIAAPCFWMGFIERQEWWLAPGLGVVLLARLLVRGSKPVNVPA